MTTSATQDFLSEILEGKPIPDGKRAYFQQRLSNRVHQLLLRLFDDAVLQQAITKKELAARIGKGPEQITRWMSYPANLTLDTISDLLIGLGYELNISATNITERYKVAQQQIILKVKDLHQLSTVDIAHYRTRPGWAGTDEVFRDDLEIESVTSLVNRKLQEVANG